ncbi:MAG: glycosyltransferase family 61 protein, partial [Candidatus Izemoplasmatales bacterium]|nr:glycosyltransferase family 61 protein [Candidatus Izemoplasmatales bacterium]
MDFIKKPVIFVLDKIVSTKGSVLFNSVFKNFPIGIVSLEFILKNDKSVKYKKTFSSEWIYRSFPKTIETSIHPKFDGLEKYSTKERFVLILKNARIAFSECYIITKKGFLIDELNPLMGRFTSKIFYQNKIPALKKIKGKLGVISNNDNYFHWMFETIPRLLSIRKLKLKPDFYLIGSDKKFKRESIQKIGIKESQIISPNKDMHILADTLIVPSFPINSGNPTDSVCRFLRDSFLKSPSKEFLKKYERIYILRGDVKKRKVSNEDEIFEYLSKKGFTKVALDNLSIEDQAKIFNSAKVIVAPHGAALSNLVFAKKGAKV